jgi:hypothetical protein
MKAIQAVGDEPTLVKDEKITNNINNSAKPHQEHDHTHNCACSGIEEGGSAVKSEGSAEKIIIESR